MWQETALNHVGMSTFVGDGMGTTHAMMRHRLIWVVTRMHVEVNRYPVWYDFFFFFLSWQLLKFSFVNRIAMFQSQFLGSIKLQT